MSRPSATVGYAPAEQGRSLPTFTALVRAVQDRTGLSQNKARRMTREYLRNAKHPNVPQLLERVDLERDDRLLTARYYKGWPDPTCETAAANVDRERGCARV